MHNGAVQGMQMGTPHERLQYARALGGYDDATEAADAMGVPRPTYLAHENGSRGFKARAERYARFFRVSFEWLATGRGEPRPDSLDARVLAMSPEDQLRVREFVDFVESRSGLKKTG